MKEFNRLAIILGIAIGAAVALVACGDGEEKERPASAGRADAIEVPPGFEAVVYFAGLEHPNSIAISPDGRLYVGQQSGEILAIADVDSDGVGDQQTVFATGLPIPLGMTFMGEDLYVSHRGKITRVSDDNRDGVADSQQDIIDDLPVGGELHQHVQNNGIISGSDGLLYVNIGIGVDTSGAHEAETAESREAHLSGTPSPKGSTTGSAEETKRSEIVEEGRLGLGDQEVELGAPDARSGTVIRFKPDGSELEIHATGFKNPIGLAFDAGGNLFATDNAPHNPEGPGELNHVIEGGDYGYPNRPGGRNGPGTVPLAAALQPSSSPNGFSFYNEDQFPAEYRGDAFIAEWGAATEDPSIGKRVVRVKLDRVACHFQGNEEVFASGFEHPIATAVGPDGSLFVAEWGSLDPKKKGTGAIYRIFYVGDAG